MYVHVVYMYILPSGLYNCILVAKDRFMFRSFCLSLFLRESYIIFFFFLWREIIQGFYLGELLRKAKRLKSGMPLAQMVSLSVWEMRRPTERSSRHITLKHSRPLTTESSFYIFFLQLSGLFHHRMDLIATAPSLDHISGPPGWRVYMTGLKQCSPLLTKKNPEIWIEALNRLWVALFTAVTTDPHVQTPECFVLQCSIHTVCCA